MLEFEGKKYDLAEGSCHECPFVISMGCRYEDIKDIWDCELLENVGKVAGEVKP